MLVLLYRDVRERPLDTLDPHLRLPGRAHRRDRRALTAENTTTQASRSVLNDTLGRVLRGHARARPHLPGWLGDLLAGPAQKLLRSHFG